MRTKISKKEQKCLQRRELVKREKIETFSNRLDVISKIADIVLKIVKIGLIIETAFNLGNVVPIVEAISKFF